MKLDVPFYKQTTPMNCGPAALKMALEFLGEKYGLVKIEKLVGIEDGKGVSTIKLAIAARELGFRAELYSKYLYFNEENLKLEFYKKHGDLNFKESEALVEKAKKVGVELYEKTISLPTILENIQKDRVMIILLNWNVITGKDSFVGHFVPITGYDSDSVYVHNHGFLNPKPFTQITKELFDKARKSPGTDEDLLIIYRKK